MFSHFYATTFQIEIVYSIWHLLVSSSLLNKVLKCDNKNVIQRTVLQYRGFQSVRRASPGDLQTVSGEAHRMEVKNDYVSHQKEITQNCLNVCDLVKRDIVVQRYSSLGELYCFFHFPRVRN